MLMIFASILVLGAVAVRAIPLELIPSGATAPFMSVNTFYPNATSQDVEERITRVLEDSLATTPELDEISSVSSSDNSRITLVFENEADMDIAYREVRDRVARVRGDLPEDVDQVNIRKHSGDGIPVAFYGLRWPESVDDRAQDMIEKHFIRRLERVDGVGQVGSWGQQEREIRIEVDRELAEAANLNIFEIAQKLSSSHFNLASGQIVESEGKFLLRSLANYQSIEELENVVVGPNDLRLDDVADVLYEYPDLERHDRWNGQPSLAVFVIKESQANTVEVCDAMAAAIEDARNDPAFSDFEIEPWFVQGNTIRESLKQVTDSGMQGGFLAIFVLLFFLRRARLTVVIALAIPLSMFMSLPFMYFSGQSINLVSLIGLMICIGLVVDNSVVVAENVSRYRQRGVGRFAAALHGASEVALPVTLATATTMVVFLPTALMSKGPTQFYMVRMVTPICVSLLGSLFVALILIPLAAAFLLDNDVFEGAEAGGWRERLSRFDQMWKDRLGRLYEATFGRLRDLYARVLRSSLRRRMDVFMVSALALASLKIPMNPETGVKFTLEQNMGGRQVNVYYTIPSHVSLEEADKFFRGLEKWFDEHRHEYGLNGEFMQIEAGKGSISMFFDKPKDGDPPYRETGQKIFEQLPTPVGWRKDGNFGDSDGARQSSFPVVIYGSDHSSVQDAKEDLERELVEIEGVKSIATRGGDNTRRDELQLKLDTSSAERLGVSAGMVGNTIAYALRGSPLPKFSGEDREIDVWIRYQKEDREELKDLLEFKVPTTTGAVVPIKSVTETQVRKGEAALVRNNKRVAALIRLELDPEKREDAVKNVTAFLSKYRLPAGLSFDADTERRAVNDQIGDLLKGMILGSIFIFLLMGFLFESFVLPLSVLPSMPLAFVGVWWFLYLTNSNIDPLASIGLMLLLGVVVNNAIVLVDFINNARAQGVERTEAIVQAGIQRFRPILMTALTTVGGMLPLAFTEAPSEGIPYQPFGKTLVGGMITSTVLTLVVVPVCYTLFDDLREVVQAWFNRKFGERPQA
jgi:HAE1 family hydrophobic/amphiphilic exporter-1